MTNFRMDFTTKELKRIEKLKNIFNVKTRVAVIRKLLNDDVKIMI